MHYGYIRVSTKEQNEERQLHSLIEFGIKKEDIFMDKSSGKDFKRSAYQKLVYRKLKHGDLLVIKSIDRLGRNYQDIIKEWQNITTTIGADIKILDMPLLDTRRSKDLLGTLISDIILQLLSFVAENERNNIRQRQAEGIAIAKAKGLHLGRPRIPMPENFIEIYEQWKTQKISPQKAIELSALTQSQFYRMANYVKQKQSLS